MTDHSLDACLRLVADRHRRRVIHHLRHEATGATAFEDLVDQLQGHSPDSKDGPLQTREELAIQLHHVHLPTLADHGVVEFEHRSGAVRYRPDERVERVLDSLPEEVPLSNP
ncbi:ArsR family transcriptional regulator [Haloplanus rubicundus]|uniref:ArsR family transcriptional regulator n=1 Tax=Haloplanus rubicundus TaxID=1547898 RepID=A0A345EB97_9EURY|nr:ArsR family transcriptional regulator [Haloplanus rubicundus]AXG06122.1 ArsR family transcriptional regulator [Haloplanus rubicundus]AXG09469.1 ArsR family transcriptional regulator [Haloplanus rubicundus]